MVFNFLRVLVRWTSNNTGLPVGVVFLLIFSMLGATAATTWDFNELIINAIIPIPFACMFWFFDRKDFWKRPKNRSQEF